MAQDRGSVLYSTIELDSHTDTIVCSYNCIIMNFMGKECDVTPLNDAYDTINTVPIVQAATSYNNPDTGDKTILIFNEEI